MLYNGLPIFSSIILTEEDGIIPLTKGEYGHVPIIKGSNTRFDAYTCNDKLLEKLLLTE